MHPTTKQIRDAIADSTDGLSESQMRHHPEGKWDAAAIVEHLALTFSGTTRAFQKCLDQGRPLATSATFKQRLIQLIVLRFNYIPSGRKRSEEHTSELQSRFDLVCRLLLEKKKKKKT